SCLDAPPSFSILRRPPSSSLFPYTTLFRSARLELVRAIRTGGRVVAVDEQDSSAMRALAASNALIRRDIHLPAADPGETVEAYLDRKSTRLNSSHVKISYAVFCLKKKKIKK